MITKYPQTMIEFRDFSKLFSLLLASSINSTLILMHDNYLVSPNYNGIQWFFKITKPAFSGLDNFYINIYTFLNMIITTIYITCNKNLILIYYFIKQIKKTNKV